MSFPQRCSQLPNNLQLTPMPRSPSNVRVFCNLLLHERRMVLFMFIQVCFDNQFVFDFTPEDHYIP